jgi:hypothetical protein
VSLKRRDPENDIQQKGGNSKCRSVALVIGKSTLYVLVVDISQVAEKDAGLEGKHQGRASS